MASTSLPAPKLILLDRLRTLHPPTANTTAEQRVGPLEKQVLFLSVNEYSIAIPGAALFQGGSGTEIPNAIDLEGPPISPDDSLRCHGASAIKIRTYFHIHPLRLCLLADI